MPTAKKPEQVAPCVASHSSPGEVYGVLIKLLRKNKVEDDDINLAMSYFLQERNKGTPPGKKIGACRYDEHCCMLTKDQCDCFGGDWDPDGDCDNGEKKS